MHIVAALTKHLRQLVELEQRGRFAVDGRQVDIRSLDAWEVPCLLVVPTAALVSAADANERRLLGPAAVVGERAAVGEDTPGELGPDAWKESRDRVQPTVILPHATARDTAEQADRVRVTRVLEDRVDEPLLDETAGVQHAHARTHLRDHAEVVADEEHGGRKLRLQLRDDVEHLRFNRRVEAGGRLVEDQEGRVLRERHCDHGPLLHAPGELVRVAAHHRSRVSDLYARQRRLRAFCRLPPGTPSTVNASATCAPTRIEGFNAAPGFW